MSPVFQVVSAKDRFRRSLRGLIGQELTLPGSGERITVDRHLADVLCRYSLSIGTPPVTAGMRRLVINASYWSMGMEDQITGSRSVDYVGPYKPLESGFNYEQLGVVPKMPAEYR